MLTEVFFRTTTGTTTGVVAGVVAGVVNFSGGSCAVGCPSLKSYWFAQ